MRMLFLLTALCTDVRCVECGLLDILQYELGQHQYTKFTPIIIQY